MDKGEKELICLLKENPERGIAQAMHCYGKTVQWIVYRILGNDTELEECVADVFFRLWQSVTRFDEIRGVSFASWAYSIARHTALDYRRKKQKSPYLLPLEETSLTLDLNLEDEIARAQNGEILKNIIDELPPPDREIFIYRYFLELPVKEIAQLLQLSEKQVENKLYRGRIRLRKQLLERGVIR